MADRLDTLNAGALFPPAVALQQGGIFASGATSIPLTIPPGASTQPAITPDPSADALADAAMRAIVAQRRRNLFDTVAQAYAEEALASSSVVTPILERPLSIVRPHFAPLKSEVEQAAPERGAR